MLALSERLQTIARSYLSARRRTGEALLEMARWLSEARDVVEHGEWKLFLDATSTAPDTAERLLNIHTLAMQNPQFADSVKRDWLSQSAAALLARPSTPQEVIVELLQAPEPPKVSEIERKIKQVRGGSDGGVSRTTGSTTAQNPQIADFAPPAVVQSSPDQPFTTEEMLHEVARVLAHLTRGADQLTPSPLLYAALDQVELALADLRRAVEQ